MEKLLIYDTRTSSTLWSLSLVFTGLWITNPFLRGSNEASNQIEGFLFSLEAKEMLVESWKLWIKRYQKTDGLDTLRLSNFLMASLDLKNMKAGLTMWD
jgi:hypothetical protein